MTLAHNVLSFEAKYLILIIVYAGYIVTLKKQLLLKMQLFHY